MALGTALLNPQVLAGPELDSERALQQDLLRLVALFVEDAASGGPMAVALEEAVGDTGASIESTLAPRLDAARSTLRAQLSGPRGYVDQLLTDVQAATDPTRIVALFRSVLGDLAALIDGLTLSGIRRAVGFAKALLEDDLGLGPDSLADLTRRFVDALRERLESIPAIEGSAGDRRRRLAAAVVVRVGARLADYTPPAIDVEILSRTIDRLLRRLGVADALREIVCALDDVDDAFVAVGAAGNAVRRLGTLERGSGLIGRSGATEYSWYASWLLNDEAVHLLGLSEVARPRDFIAGIQDAGDPLTTFLREQFEPVERTVLDSWSDRSQDPLREVLLTTVGVINRTMQREPILPAAEGADRLAEDRLTDEIRELRRNYVDDQTLLEYNRLVLLHAFADELDPGKPWYETVLSGAPGGPSNQVYVTGDRRIVMCDDRPMHVGEGVHWYDAPMFAEAHPGQFHYRFEHVSAETCEVLAQLFHAAGDLGKGVWHLVELPPGHRVGAGIVASIELADVVQQLLFGSPISGYFLEGSPFVRGVGKWLDSAAGPKGLTVLLSSLEGVVGRDDEDLFFYWLTVFMGDAIRTVGPIQTVNTVRDVLLSFVTLLNFRGPQDAPSTLPSNPAANHKKQGPFVSVSDTLFAMLLTSLYDRDDYSIFIWTKAGIGDRRAGAMLKHWVGGSAGLGLLAGLAGSFVAQVIAWAEDFKRFFVTGAKSAGKMFVLFWIYQYLFKENDTDDGRYRPGGGSFRGYRPPGTSPYRLPVPAGEGVYVGQANLGLFSHNFITNSNFETPPNSATQQAYAFDFDHEFKEGIACVRAGTVESFVETEIDSNPDDWNFLIIRHATVDPVHDDFGSSPVQTYTVYGHLARFGVRNAPAFGGTPPAIGTVVNRGDIIALAGDTGMSFHNHLHLHVLRDDGTGSPDQSATSLTIPFVFGDVPGDGVPKSITWYRSGNS